MTHLDDHTIDTSEDGRQQMHLDDDVRDSVNIHSVSDVVPALLVSQMLHSEDGRTYTCLTKRKIILARISCAVVPINQLSPSTNVPALQSPSHQCRLSLERVRTYPAMKVLNEASKSPTMMMIETT